MNPYTYKRGQRQAAPGPAVPASSGTSWPKAVLTAKINPAIALAFVLFAASSTGAMATVASAEIAAGSYTPVSHQVAFKPQAYVLGDSTTTPDTAIIDDSSLEAAVSIPSVKLTARAKSFNSTLGRWDYLINYSSQNLNGTGSITIGTYIVAGDMASSTGSVETGAILKPSTTYHVIFWVTDSNGNQLAAAQATIKTPKGKTSGQNPVLISPCQAPTQATSTPNVSLSASSTPGAMFCLKTTQGQMLCPRPPVCGQMMPGGNASGTPPNWPPFRPAGGSPSSTPGHMPPFFHGQQGSQQQGPDGSNNPGNQ